MTSPTVNQSYNSTVRTTCDMVVSRTSELVDSACSAVSDAFRRCCRESLGARIRRAAAEHMKQLSLEHSSRSTQLKALQSSSNRNDLERWKELLGAGVWYPVEYSEACEAALEWTKRVGTRSDQDVIDFGKNLSKKIENFKTGWGQFGQLPKKSWCRIKTNAKNFNTIFPDANQVRNAARIATKRVAATEKKRGYMPFSFQIRPGVRPSIAVDDLNERKSLLVVDCNLIQKISELRAVKDLLGSDLFDRVGSFCLKNHRSPIRLSFMSNNWWEQGEVLRFTTLPQVGDAIYFPNHSDYNWKHPDGGFQGSNTIVTKVDWLLRPRCTGTHTPIDATSEQIQQYLVSAFNQTADLSQHALGDNAKKVARRFANVTIQQKHLPSPRWTRMNFDRLEKLVDRLMVAAHGHSQTRLLS